MDKIDAVIKLVNKEFAKWSNGDRYRNYEGVSFFEFQEEVIGLIETLKETESERS